MRKRPATAAKEISVDAAVAASGSCVFSSVGLKHSSHLSLPEHDTEREADWSVNQPEAESASRREKSEISVW